MVLVLEYADGLHPLRHGAFAGGWGIRRPFESAVQMLEMRENHDRRDQAASGFHGGDVTAPIVCKGKRYEFEPELAAARPRNSPAGKNESGAEHSVGALEGRVAHA